MGENWRETMALPQELHEYADRVESLPKYVQEGWEPQKTAVISQLVWYLKKSTRKARYQEAATLLDFFHIPGVWNTTSLKSWCSRHKEEIRQLGPLEIIPVLPRPLRKK